MWVRHQRQRRRSECGQIGTWMTLTVAGALLALGVTGFSRLATAADQDSKLQVAADAAALAGAQSIARDADDVLMRLLNGERVTINQLGRAKAAELAEENGAKLVPSDYNYSATADEVTVRVWSDKPLESGKPEYAEATARLGKRLYPCKFPRRPQLPPLPTASPTLPAIPPTPGTPPPPPPPPPPPNIEREIRCGDLPAIPFVFPGIGGPGVIDWASLDLDDMVKDLRLRPRLVD